MATIAEIVEKLVGSYTCLQGAVRAVRFNVDGNYCLTCGSDKSVKLWNPHKGLLLKTYNGHGHDVLDAHSSPDSAQFCSCSVDKTVALWDVASGKISRKFRGHAGQVNVCKFNGEGSVILSGSIDTTIRVWDCRSRSQNPIQVMDEAKDSVTSLYISNYEILSGSADGRVRRYDIRNGKLIVDCIGKTVTSICLTRDGQCILVGSVGGPLVLLDTESGELLNEYSGHKNKEYKLDSVISADDKLILSGSEDGIVYVWDLLETKLVGRLSHNTVKVVPSLSYHPSETCLLTACADTMYVWKSRYGQSQV